MDWDKVYDRLRSAMYDGKNINSEDFIKRINKLNEWHRKMLVEYFDHFPEDKLNTFHTYKYHILRLLEHINKINFPELLQSDINNYMESQKNKKPSYVNNIQYAIKNYFDFYADRLSFTPEYIFKDDDSALINKKLPLTCKELENIRSIISRGNMDYLQYIFELAYENGIRFEESRYYSEINYDHINGRFKSPNGEYIVLSKRLKEIIEKIKDTEEFKNPYYKQGFSKSKLYDALKNNGFGRAIKSSDVTTSFKEKTSFKCPSCGGIYESTAVNWVIKQYYDNGELWIVCKENCGAKNENI